MNEKNKPKVGEIWRFIPQKIYSLDYESSYDENYMFVQELEDDRWKVYFIETAEYRSMKWDYSCSAWEKVC